MAHFTFRDLPTGRVQSNNASKSPALPPAGQHQQGMPGFPGVALVSPLVAVSVLPATPSPGHLRKSSLSTVQGDGGSRNRASLGESPLEMFPVNTGLWRPYSLQLGSVGFGVSQPAFPSFVPICLANWH